MAFVLCVAIAGCSGTGEQIPQDRIDRIHRELGLVAPYRTISAGFVPDGGSAISGFTDAGGETLWVLIDGRMWYPGAPYRNAPREHHVHLASRLGWEHARPLAFESPAESAVVDLFRWSLRSVVSVAEESTLARGERAARSTPSGFSSWHSSLSPAEERARTLRRMIERVEQCRREAQGLRHVLRRAIRNQLGLEMPVRLLFAGRIDDGGSGVVEVVDSRDETLSIFQDNRMVLHSPKDRIDRPRFVYLHGGPEAPGSRRLETNSPPRAPLSTSSGGLSK